MKYFTADKETGTFIEEVKNIEEGLKLIEEYEEADKADGTYEEGFYDIVDEDHCTRLNNFPAQYKYDSANTMQFKMKLNKKTDEDIIGWLSAQDNKQGKVKELIRKEIDKK